MRSSHRATVGLGVGFYLAGVFLFALNDALGKWLVADYGVGRLMMLRSIGAACVLRADGPFAAPGPLRRHTGALILWGLRGEGGD
jgi:S-adenosylmethionine uptake transporter